MVSAGAFVCAVTNRNFKPHFSSEIVAFMTSIKPSGARQTTRWTLSEQYEITYLPNITN